MPRITDQHLKEWTDRIEQTSHADLAWLAGILEGEGSFHIQSTRRYSKVKSLGPAHRFTPYLHLVRYPKVSVTMTDRDIIERVSVLLASKCGGPYTSHFKPPLVYKPKYTTTLSGDKALKLCDLLYVFMGQRRRVQIDNLRQTSQHRVTLVQPLKPRFSVYEPGSGG